MIGHAPLLAVAWAIAASSPGPDAAAPEGSPVRLHWSAPAQCPGADVVQRSIEARLSSAARPVDARATVEPDGEGEWRLDLEMTTPEGRETRTLRATTCASLADATGLLVAIAADPGAATASTAADGPVVVEPPADAAAVPPDVPAPPARTEPARATPGPAPPSTSGDAAAASVAPTPEPRAARRVRGVLRIDGIAQLVAVLPRAASGALGAAAGVTWAHARLEGRGRWSFAQRASYPSPSSVGGPVGGDIDLWTLGGAGCWVPRAGPVELPLCGGVELGQMRGRSFGTASDGVGRSLWVALPLDLSLSWAPIGWLALRVGAEAAAVVRRPAFHVRGLPELFRAAPATVRIVAGLEARFP